MVEFAKIVNEHKRMCESFKMCGKCPLGKEHGLVTQCRDWTFNNPAEAEEIIMKWAAEHPIVTNGMKFEEIFGVPFGVVSCGSMLSISKWINSEYKGR